MKFKTNTTLMIALILFVFGLPPVAWAQDMDDGQATAEVQEIPISLTEVRALSFGTFVPLGSPGSVVVPPDNTATRFNGVHRVEDGLSAYWRVLGVPGATWDLIIVSDSTSLTYGNENMEVIGIEAHGPSGTFDGSGEDGFGIGATLHVNANQAPGFYTGTYQLRAAYN